MSEEIGDDGVADEVKTTAKEAIAFAALRGASNALWIGGTVVSVAAQRNLGVDPLLACGVVGTSVAATEYAGTSLATKIFSESDHTASADKPSSTFSAIAKDGLALSYAAWSGAMSTVEVNNSLGLESTKKRRLGQSATYGFFVSLYGSQIWGFRHGQDAIIDAGNEALKNPGEAAVVGAMGSVAIYGALRLFQNFREKRQLKKNKPDDAKEL